MSLNGQFGSRTPIYNDKVLFSQTQVLSRGLENFPDHSVLKARRDIKKKVLSKQVLALHDSGN